MPITGRPDVNQPYVSDFGMKAGMYSDRDMKFNPGRPADEIKTDKER
jgi:hypothetical protein